MPKIICVKCEIEFRPEKNGIIVKELFQKNTQIYKIIYADLWECPICGNQIIAGFADNPLAEHYQKERMEKALEIVKTHEAKDEVFNWKELI